MRRRGSSQSRTNEQSTESQSTYCKLINESNVNLSQFEKFVKGKLEYRHNRSSSMADSHQEAPKKVYAFKMPFLAKDLKSSARKEGGTPNKKSNVLVEEEFQGIKSKEKLNLLVSKEIFKKNSVLHDDSQSKCLSSRRTAIDNNQLYPSGSLSELEPKHQDIDHDNNLSTFKMRHNASRTTNFTVFTRNHLNDSIRNSKIFTKINSHNMSLVGSVNDLLSSKVSPKEEHHGMSECVGSIVLPQESACPSLVLPEIASQHQPIKFKEDRETDMMKGLSELEIQQKLEKIVNRETRETSSRESSRYKSCQTEVNPIPENSAEQIVLQAQKEAEVNKIHKHLVLKLKAQLTSPKQRSMNIRENKSKRSSKENSFSISRSTKKHNRASSVGAVPLDKSISMISNKQSAVDRSFRQQPKQKMPQLETIPEWLRKREDFKGAFEARQDELSKIIITTCEKLPYSRTEEEVKVIQNWLRNVRLFEHLPDFMVYNIGMKLKHQSFQKDETICKQGDPEDCLFIVYDGMVKSFISDVEDESFQTFDTIGQSPLDNSLYRLSRLVAETPTSMLTLARHEYRNILEQHLTMEKTAYFFFLNEVDFLKTIDEKKRKLICSRLKSKRYIKGQIIYDEGEETERFYILRSGKVQIESKITIEKENIWPTGKKAWEKTRHVRDMKYHHDILPKQYFGEVEILDGCPRLNRVVCAENAEILTLMSREVFEIFSRDELSRLRHSVQTSILEEIVGLKQRVIEEENEKKKIMDTTVKTLLSLKENTRNRNIFRPKAHSLQPLAKKIQNSFQSYVQQNTIKTLKAHEILLENPYNS